MVVHSCYYDALNALPSMSCLLLGASMKAAPDRGYIGLGQLVCRMGKGV